MPTARSRVPLPFAGLTPLFGAAALRDADQEASRRFGLPSVVLMERAGLESARAISARWPAARAAVVLVGTGNNGGDGMVVARHLAEAGWRVEIISAAGAAPTTPDAHMMSNVALAMGAALGPFDAGAHRPAGAVLVDGLLGTGTRGAPRAPLDAIIDWAAGWPGPVVALDVPSGVDADTGHVAGACIAADLTVTYHGDKPGLHIEPGRARAGEVVVVDTRDPQRGPRGAPGLAGWAGGRRTDSGQGRRGREVRGGFGAGGGGRPGADRGRGAVRPKQACAPGPAWSWPPCRRRSSR